VPFGVVSGVDRGMGVLDGGGDRRRRRGSFGGEFGASHCIQWGAFFRRCVTATHSFQITLGEDLFG